MRRIKINTHWQPLANASFTLCRGATGTMVTQLHSVVFSNTLTCSRIHSVQSSRFRSSKGTVLSTNVLLFRPALRLAHVSPAAAPRPLCRHSTSQARSKAPAHPVTRTHARDTHATQTFVGAQIRSDTRRQRMRPAASGEAEQGDLPHRARPGTGGEEGKSRAQAPTTRARMLCTYLPGSSR